MQKQFSQHLSLLLSSRFVSTSTPKLRSVMPNAAALREWLVQSAPPAQRFNAYAAFPFHVFGYFCLIGGGIGASATVMWIRDTIGDGDRNSSKFSKDFLVLNFRVFYIVVTHFLQAAYGFTFVPFQHVIADLCGMPDAKWEWPQRSLEKEISRVVNMFMFRGDGLRPVEADEKAADLLRLEISASEKAQKLAKEEAAKLSREIQKVKDEKAQEVAQTQGNSQLLQAARVTGGTVLVGMAMVCACLWLSIRRHDASRRALRSCRVNLRVAERELSLMRERRDKIGKILRKHEQDIMRKQNEHERLLVTLAELAALQEELQTLSVQHAKVVKKLRDQAMQIRWDAPKASADVEEFIIPPMRHLRRLSCTSPCSSC